MTQIYSVKHALVKNKSSTADHSQTTLEYILIIHELLIKICTIQFLWNCSSFVYNYNYSITTRMQYRENISFTSVDKSNNIFCQFLLCQSLLWVFLEGQNHFYYSILVPCFELWLHESNLQLRDVLIFSYCGNQCLLNGHEATC